MKYLALLCGASLFVACTTVEETKVGSRVQNQSCRRVSDCKVGLDCLENPDASSNPMAPAKVCLPIMGAEHPSQGGQVCAMDADCEENYCCGNGKICRSQREEFAGECGSKECARCGLSFDCAPDLICNGYGLCIYPDASTGPVQQCQSNDDCLQCGYLCMNGGCRALGTADVDEPCEETAECRKPLVCHPVLMGCQKPPFFAGTSCKQSEAERGQFRPYFKVPRFSPLEPDEFYALPYPNDIRTEMGKPVMEGHYAPDPDLLGFDLGGIYFGAIETDLDGYGLSQPVFFRYTDPIDRATLTSTAATPSVYLVNIDKNSDNYGEKIPSRQVYINEKGQFMCALALGVAPVDGRALEPNTLHAAILTTAITSRWGAAPIQDQEFKLMLVDNKPNDPILDAAHQVYAPLRAYLKDEGISSNSVAVATVYRTGNPGALAPKLRQAVRSAQAPEILEIAVCGTDEPISCNATNDPVLSPRGCFASNDFVELHAKIRHPVMQTNVRPYKLPPNGRIELNNNGIPLVQGYEELCISIAIPKNHTMPTNGWPVVIYGHGTGGNFTSVIRTATVSNRLAKQGIAVIGFDGMMHGPRQTFDPANPDTRSSTTSWKDPGLVFFNAINPRASQFNVMQGSADIFNLVRFVEQEQLPVAQAGMVGGGKFDADKIMYYGHSQGTVIAPPVAAHEPLLKAVVLTGAGAEIGLTVVHKRKPNDLTGTVRSVLGDQSITRLHPMIGILSWYFGNTDAIAFGRLIAQDRSSPGRPVNYLHVYGVGDGFTPDVTQKALVRASGAPIFGDELAPLDDYTPAFSARQGNVEVGGIKATVGVLQYENPVPNSDGHFTGTHNKAAADAIQLFLRTAISDSNGAVIQR